MKENIMKKLLFFYLLFIGCITSINNSTTCMEKGKKNLSNSGIGMIEIATPAPTTIQVPKLTLSPQTVRPIGDKTTNSSPSSTFPQFTKKDTELTKFVAYCKWATEEYPADQYELILWDHDAAPTYENYNDYIIRRYNDSKINNNNT